MRLGPPGFAFAFAFALAAAGDSLALLLGSPVGPPLPTPLRPWICFLPDPGIFLIS